MRVKCSCLGEGPNKLHSSVTFVELQFLSAHPPTHSGIGSRGC